MTFDTFSSFFYRIGHYWMPKRLCSKNSNQLPVLNRLTGIFAVGKFDYGVMVRYQNLTRKPELFRAPLGPGPSTMYPLNPPLAGPVGRYDVYRRYADGLLLFEIYSNIRNYVQVGLGREVMEVEVTQM